MVSLLRKALQAGVLYKPMFMWEFRPPRCMKKAFLMREF